jgi:hypothetical protein
MKHAYKLTTERIINLQYLLTENRLEEVDWGKDQFSGLKTIYYPFFGVSSMIIILFLIFI